MQYITVTTLQDGCKIRLSVEKLEAWEPGYRGGTVIRFAGQSLEVTEPPDIIDKLVDKPEP